MHITPVKFYVSYYPNFNALAIQCVTALPHYHFTLLKCIHLLALDVDGLSIPILTPILAPYSHEKRLHGSLYHNHIKPPKIAFKYIINYVRFIGLFKTSSFSLPILFLCQYGIIALLSHISLNTRFLFIYCINYHI